MAASATATSSGETKNKAKEQTSERLKTLYPAVNEEECPLPKHWSPKDKYNFIGLSQNNLRVHYKGVGKTHKDAASVRANGPIPASCGIYYFEVKIVSKGRDGYMGIGLSVQGVNLNRLPGWDTHSYGYHGDDGHSFCSSGQGKPYGPTFTTGDVVGCCINLIDNTCFYTKNGVNLGIAFKDLPANLYPTVGLQTPGEVIEANFGQNPFVFDIEDYMKEWKLKTKLTIERFPVADSQGEWQTALQKIVSTYLVHHGYCATAEAFARSTGQSFDEELVSIKNRQRIQKLVLAGRMGEAIETTRELYPGLLDRSPDLLFTLKCRQFIEMVNGTDSQVRGSAVIRSPKSHGSARSSPSMSPLHHSLYSAHGRQSPATAPTIPSYSNSAPNSNSVITSSQARSLSPHTDSKTSSTTTSSQQQSPLHIIPPSSSSNTKSNSPPIQQQTSSSSSANNQVQQQPQQNTDLQTISEDEMVMNNVNSGLHSNNSHSNNSTGSGGNIRNGVTSSSQKTGSVAAAAHQDAECDSDDMDTSESDSRTLSNGVANGSCMNGTSHGEDDLTQDDIDMEDECGPPHKRQLCGGSQLAIEKMLQFGRELHAMSETLRREFGSNENNKNALKDAFSLLAYSDPWSSPVGAQLDPVQREPVCAALNSAILESHGLPKQPPLELAIGQVSECMALMSRAGVGSCAFANLQDYIH